MKLKGQMQLAYQLPIIFFFILIFVNILPINLVTYKFHFPAKRFFRRFFIGHTISYYPMFVLPPPAVGCWDDWTTQERTNGECQERNFQIKSIPCVATHLQITNFHLIPGSGYPMPNLYIYLSVQQLFIISLHIDQQVAQITFFISALVRRLYATLFLRAGVPAAPCQPGKGKPTTIMELY